MILVLLGDQLKLLKHVVTKRSTTERTRDALIIRDLSGDPPLHTLGVHVLAAAVATVCQVMLLFHGVEADAALFVFFEVHSLHLNTLLRTTHRIPHALLAPLRLLQHHFVRCLAHPSLRIHLVPIQIVRDGLISPLQNRGHLAVQVAVLPEHWILGLHSEDLEERVHRVCTVHGVILGATVLSRAAAGACDFRAYSYFEFLLLFILECQHCGTIFID